MIRTQLFYAVKVVSQDRISDNTSEKSVKLVNRDINICIKNIVISAESECVCVQVCVSPSLLLVRGHTPALTCLLMLTV